MRLVAVLGCMGLGGVKGLGEADQHHADGGVA
jgi:hypothetical protein